MTTPETNYRVEFVIYDFTLDPDELTERLQLTPSTIERPGMEIQARQSGRLVRVADANVWSLVSNLPDGAAIDDQFDQLLATLRPHKTYLQTLIKTGGSHWEIYGTSSDVSGKVNFHLTQTVLAELNEYSAEIDVDLYWSATD